MSSRYIVVHQMQYAFNISLVGSITYYLDLLVRKLRDILTKAFDDVKIEKV